MPNPYTLSQCALHDLRRDLDEVARAKREAGDPDALAVDPDGTSVDHRLRGPARKRELEREKILQDLRIGFADRQRGDAGGVLGRLAHIRS